MSGEQSGQSGNEGASVDPRVVEMLVCPLTKTLLVLSRGGDELISSGARLAFPIRKGVALLCLDEARPLSEEEEDRLNRGRPL
jgi:uncharacterized protein